MNEESVVRLRLAVMRLARTLRLAGAEEGLSPAQASALATLARDGPMRAGDLAVAEALNPTMVSRILAHLEDEGLAGRAPDPDDRRATRAEATRAGRRLIKRMRARHRALLAERMADLPPEHVAALLAALPALEALAAGPPPPVRRRA